MLLAEAVIAEIMGTLLLSYTSIKHIKGSEGIAMAAVIWSIVLFAVIPLTKYAVG
jgi:hypothetical protein